MFLTDAEGKVREYPNRGREIDSTFEFPKDGVYELELLGYGAPGTAPTMAG